MDNKEKLSEVNEVIKASISQQFHNYADRCVEVVGEKVCKGCIHYPCSEWCKEAKKVGLALLLAYMINTARWN